VDSTELIEVVEGNASVLVPNPLRYMVGNRPEPARAPVFFNPAMSSNRSISIAIVQAFIDSGSAGTLCEPLGGSGVRSVRYLLEVKGLERVIVGDINPEAVELIKSNMERNGVIDRAIVVQEEANSLLSRIKCDIVDLDPFGSPAPFVSSAIRAVSNNGLLCVTATDLGVLEGRHYNKAVRRYGVFPLRVPFSREIGLRALIGFIAREALIYDIGVEPLIAYHEKHYYRACMRIIKDRAAAVESLKSIGFYRYDPKTLRRELVRGYPIGAPGLGGPIWIGNLMDPSFIEATAARAGNDVAGFINRLSDEAVAPPLYYRLSELGKLLPVTPSMSSLISIASSMGVKIWRTHFAIDGFKMDEKHRLPKIVNALRVELRREASHNH
jgi:tRNA (guanine26-N2/guanine27-N2)-dimethyltransferase